jgi:UDP-N-acetyl-D-mannosaminuronic acid transferase (WecB/TagA/CpsF family)
MTDVKMTAPKILGVSFCTYGPDLIPALREGGLVQVPSGPGLADDLRTKPAYAQALLEADYVIPDSGLMVLIWNRWLRPPSAPGLERYSGLRLLRDLLPRSEVQAEGASFWIMPTAADQEQNLNWLQAEGHRVSERDCYLAPFYRNRLDSEGSVEDPELLARIEERKPRYIFVNVGSGVQEQLGWYLQKNLTYRPAILCTGAAISFLSGGQAEIPPWADKLYLGWLLRVHRDPLRFGKRYLSAIKLVPLMLKYRDQLPQE